MRTKAELKQIVLLLRPHTRAGENLRFKKKISVFRFLGFNVYAQPHAVHWSDWTQEYDQEEGLYTKVN